MRILLDLYLEKNLGDDLFLVSILERYPQHDFYVFTQVDYAELEEDYPNLTIVRRNKVINALIHRTNNKISMMKQFIRSNNIDGLAVVGGSIFIEFPNWEKLYKERLSLWNYFIERDKPVFVIGSNFGPYQSNQFLESYRTLFSIVTDVCMRDEYSYQLFNDLPNVRLAADAVFSMGVTERMKTPGTVAISVIDLSNRPSLSAYDEVYIEQLQEWINKFTSERYEVTLMSFCQSEGDESQITQIMNGLDHSPAIKQLFYNGDVKAFLAEFGRFEKVVATRFHSIVLSLMYNKELFALNYSKKSENLIKDNTLNIEMESINNINSLDYERLMNQFNIHKDINELVSSSNKQFIALDSFLDGGI